MIYIGPYRTRTGEGTQIKLQNRYVRVDPCVKIFFDLLNRQRGLSERVLRRYGEKLVDSNGYDDLYVILLCKLKRTCDVDFKQKHPFRKGDTYRYDTSFHLSCPVEEFKFYTSVYLGYTKMAI